MSVALCVFRCRISNVHRISISWFQHITAGKRKTLGREILKLVCSKFTQARCRISPANLCIPGTFYSSLNVVPITWLLPQSFQKKKLERKSVEKTWLELLLAEMLTIFPIDCHDTYCSPPRPPSVHATKSKRLLMLVTIRYWKHADTYLATFMDEFMFDD